MNNKSSFFYAVFYITFYVFVALVFSYFTLAFFFSVFANTWPGPYNDYWADLTLIKNYFESGELYFNDLIKAHNNSHRLLIPRLLFILDFKFASATNSLLIFVSLLCKLATILTLNLITKDQSLKIRLLLNALFIAAIFNAGNVYNVVHNSNNQWDLVALFSLLSVYFFTKIHDHSANLKKSYLLLSLLFFTLGFLTQGSIVPVLFVFIFITIIDKKPSAFFISVALLVVVFVLSELLPISNPGKQTLGRALPLLLFKPLIIVEFTFRLMSGTLSYYLGNVGFYFSAYLFSLLVFSLLTIKKTGNVYNNFFIYFSFYLFLLMALIALGRADFSPNHHWASRFQTHVLLFILAINVHVYFAGDILFTESRKKLFKGFVLLNAFLMLFLIQYFSYKDAFNLSNRIFRSQANMLTQGVNQFEGGGLITHYNEVDLVEGLDPFFRKNGLGYYFNKRDTNKKNSLNAVSKIGETLVNKAEMLSFKNACIKNTGQVAFNQYNDSQFSITLNNDEGSFLETALFRDTYYVLNQKGGVVGFAYISIEPEGDINTPTLRAYRRAMIKGYAKTEDIHYLAEFKQQNHNKNKLECLYSFH